MAIYAWTRPTLFISISSFHPETNTTGMGFNPENPISFILGSGRETVEGTMMIGVLKSRNLSEGISGDSIPGPRGPVLLADSILNNLPPNYNPIVWISGLFSEDAPLPLRNKKIQAGRVIRGGLTLTTTEEGFIKMEVAAFRPELAGLIADKMIDALSAYYKEQKTAKAEANVVFFNIRADSIRKELDTAAAEMAYYQDKNRYRNDARNTLYLTKKQVEIGYLQEMYTQLIISAETAKSQLKQDTPIIQVLDYPEPPYIVLAKSLVVYGIAGLILGLMLGAAWTMRNFIIEDLLVLIRNEDPEQRASGGDNPTAQTTEYSQKD